MTIVVGTAGHIDHGKTTLLRALTGIDADRLPEERRRGMTIDVGYAHLALDDGRAIDFVDVPGHDRLIGNMLVGAGEIDAALLVVAADDGPRAQTLEHLALLDALGIGDGLAVVTKTDAVDPARVDDVVRATRAVLAETALAGVSVLPVSGTTGAGLDAVHSALVDIAARQGESAREGPPTLPVDRVFTVRGRGIVVTGTLRGGPLATGDRLRVVPGGGEARIREIQVHGQPVDRVAGGGRVALNLAGIDAHRLHRGVALTTDPTVVATDRMLAVFRAPVADRARGRLHVATAAADAVVGRAGWDALTLPDGRAAGIVRLAEAVAIRPGDRFVLRRGPTVEPVGGHVLDPMPPRGLSRRRQSSARVASLAAGDPDARLDLHGALVEPDGRVRLAIDVGNTAAEAVLAAATSGPVPITAARSAGVAAIRRGVRIDRSTAVAAAADVVDALTAAGRLEREGDSVRRPGTRVAEPDPRLVEAMTRLEAGLATTTPPALSEAARAAGCPPDGIRVLERSGRIVVLEPDLAYAMTTYRDLASTALRMAAVEPLTPAAFRDATGTSRKYVMAILEDLDRKAILRRTPAGHLPGPKAPASVRAPATR